MQRRSSDEFDPANPHEAPKATGRKVLKPTFKEDLDKANRPSENGRNAKPIEEKDSQEYHFKSKTIKFTKRKRQSRVLAPTKDITSTI